jgi:hypothetical protein
MDEPKYRVVFSGELTGEFDHETTCVRLAKLFGLDDERARSLLTERDYIIKSNLTQATAMTYLVRMAEAGCESYVQEVVDTDVPEYQEKRSNSERRQRTRRPSRAGAIVPDRRIALRRSYDVRQFRDIVRHGSAIPLPYLSYTPPVDS